MTHKNIITGTPAQVYQVIYDLFDDRNDVPDWILYSANVWIRMGGEAVGFVEETYHGGKLYFGVDDWIICYEGGEWDVVEDSEFHKNYEANDDSK